MTRRGHRSVSQHIVYHVTQCSDQIWEFAAHLYPGSRQEMQTITRQEELQEIPHASPPPIYLTKGGGAAKVEIVNTLEKHIYSCFRSPSIWRSCRATCPG